MSTHFLVTGLADLVALEEQHLRAAFARVPMLRPDCIIPMLDVELLSREGLIRSQRGVGTRVAADAREGVAAFKDKRRPQWTGQ